MKAHERFGVGWTDPRGVFGTPVGTKPIWRVMRNGDWWEVQESVIGSVVGFGWVVVADNLTLEEAQALQKLMMYSNS